MASAQLFPETAEAVCEKDFVYLPGSDPCSFSNQGMERGTRRIGSGQVCLVLSQEGAFLLGGDVRSFSQPFLSVMEDIQIPADLPEGEAGLPADLFFYLRKRRLNKL